MIQRVKCCSSCFPPPNGSGEAALPPATVDGDGGIVTREDAYRQIDDLDFMKAATILFTTPPKRKQFGFDLRLEQFFFVCMPSLAVYLVAQYARYGDEKNGGG